MPEELANLRYQRAKVLFDAAERLQHDGPPSERGRQLARLDLYRQASWWGLVAMSPSSTKDWGNLLLGLPGVSERSTALLTATAEADEALDDAALSAAVADLAAVARRVMTLLEAPDRALQSYWHRQTVRAALGFMMGLVLIPSIAFGLTELLKPADLAKGKPWRASSKYADCYPHIISCGGARTAIFFHTLQENEPWVEIDLGAPTEFTSVEVWNRSDGWGDRAYPLALEVSDDQSSWRFVNRQDEEQKVWRVKFQPLTARYVRLRALRNTILHLDSVRVYR